MISPDWPAPPAVRAFVTTREFGDVKDPAVRDEEDGKHAVTHYRLRERFRAHALLQCSLETGRTHQIRVHFQHIRHPLVGDETYRRGTRHGISFPRQALHATELALIHPATHKSVSWKSPLPRDMKRLVDTLRNDQS